MGFCTTVVRRSTVPCLLAALAACDQSAPATFDPEGAAADAAALHAVFETPLMRSLAFAGAEIDQAMGGLEGEAAPARRDSGASGRLFEAMAASTRPRFTIGDLPATVAGRTYVFDADASAYVASEVTGAPPSGARFQLYAIDPATDLPAEPLAPLGYVDVIGEGSSGVRLRVADNDGVRLEYVVSSSGSGPDARIEVAGFSSAGGSRADFGFDNRVEVTGASSGMMRLSETLALPSRDAELACASLLLVRAGLPPELQLELTLRGPSGEVDVEGAYELGGSGALAVNVNGDSYAQVHVDGSEFTIAGTAADPLPVSAVEMLDRVVGARESGLELFDRLVRPVESLIAP